MVWRRRKRDGMAAKWRALGGGDIAWHGGGENSSVIKSMKWQRSEGK